MVQEDKELLLKDIKEQRMRDCPYRQVGCTMYKDKILECSGTCSWVVDYLKLKKLKAQKEEYKHLWKPADGDDLPEIDREVVAFQEIFPTDVDVTSLLKVVIAHRPNPKGYDGKSIATGKVEHYTPKTYDKGGWNIPDVVLWLDLDIPQL